jgi:hypothetical protein
MSGGFFDYDQYKISIIADDVEGIIARNTEHEPSEQYSAETMAEFKKAVNVLRMAAIYAHRIDWLVSGDDSEDSFHERLHSELGLLKSYNNLTLTPIGE